MDEDETWHTVRPRPWPHCVSWDLAPPQKGHSHQFSADVYCGQMAVCIRIPLGTEVGLRLGDIVLDGDPVPPPLTGHSPQFSANVCCGQMAGWIKIQDGTLYEVDLGPGHIVLDGDPAPHPSPRKGAKPVNFRCISAVAKWLDGSRSHLVGRKASAQAILC